MRAREIMTDRPACCTSEATLQEAARLMLEHDCGEIPVTDKKEGRLVGVITDRDICCRAVAAGKGPSTEVSECMSSDVIAIPPEADVEECIQLMEQYQIRRLPVVDQNGRCLGVIAQADIAEELPETTVAEVVRVVSKPGPMSGVF